MEYDAVDVTFVVPPADTRVTQWYARPSNPMAVAQNASHEKREKEIWDAIKEGALANQKAQMAKALGMARDLDQASPQITNRTPERVERIARIEREHESDRQRYDYDPVRDFAERLEAFTALFDDDLVKELVAHLIDRFDTQLLYEDTSEGIDTRTKYSMTEEAITSLSDAIEAVETLPPLAKTRAVSAARHGARAIQPRRWRADGTAVGGARHRHGDADAATWTRRRAVRRGGLEPTARHRLVADGQRACGRVFQVRDHAFE